MLARMSLLNLAMVSAGALLINFGTVGNASAQAMFGIADPASMDAMSGMGQGAAATGQLGLERARGVAGGDPFAGDPFAAQPNQFGGGDPFGAQPNPYGAYDPSMMMGDPAMMDPAMMDPAMMMGGGFGFNQGAFGPQQPPRPAQPVIPQVSVIFGERVICAVTGTMLADAYEVPVFQNFLDNYYDDGETGLDYRAGDGIHTNVVLVENRMAPEAHLVKTRLVRGFQTLENIEPIRFFNVSVASTDPMSPLPNTYQLEEERDQKLTEWSQRFLRDFRVDPDSSGEWEFFPTHLPAPPFPPVANMPANFFPPFLSEEQERALERAERGQQGGQGQGAGAPGFSEFDGMSSQYMDAGGVR